MTSDFSRSSSRPETKPQRHRAWRARLLAGGLPLLAFDEPLETQFRRWYTQHVRARIRNAMWMPMCALLLVMLGGGPFETLRATILGEERQTLIDALRFGVILPTCVAMLLVTYTDLYSRWFTRVAQIVLPLHSICFIVFDALMHKQGYSLSSMMPLLVLAPYLLFSMLQAQALQTSAMVVVIYALGGYLGGLESGQRMFDLFIVLFSAALGVALHYSLQKAVRHNYLSTQLMSESLNRDALTGIHNRRMFDDHATRLWQQAMRTEVPVALLMIDIDHFKAFNDHGGHQAGDACLVKVAGMLSRAARRPLDLTARYGGEEFAVLLYDIDRAGVEEVCRELHTNLANLGVTHPAFSGGRSVTISIGAACVRPLPGRHVEGLIQLADEALYTAKERGRNRTVVMDREYQTLKTGTFRVERRPRSSAA